MKLFESKLREKTLTKKEKNFVNKRDACELVFEANYYIVSTIYYIVITLQTYFPHLYAIFRFKSKTFF